MAECLSVIVVFWQVFPLWSLEKRQPTVLVVCGPDQNGCVGLACARHLRVFVSNHTTRFSLICDHCDWRMCVCVTGIHPHRLHPQTLLRQSSSGPDGSVWADGPAVPVLPAHWGEIRLQWAQLWYQTSFTRKSRSSSTEATSCNSNTHTKKN